MKKILCLILSLVMILSLASGCAGQQTPTEAPPATEAPATVVPFTKTSDPETPATVAPFTQTPVTEVPGTEVPSTEVPATAEPATEPPTTEEPATEPPETEPPTTAAPEEGSALYAYMYAGQPENYRLKTHWEMSRSMGNEMLITTEDRDLTVLNAGDADSLKAFEQWDRQTEGNAFSGNTSFRFWHFGKNTLLKHKNIFYRAEQDAEGFLNARPPLAMLTPAKYESIEWTDDSRTAIRFSEALDTEWEWLGMDCTDITEASGTVELDEQGRIARTVYDAVFALEGIDIAVHVTAELEECSDSFELPDVNPDPVIPVKNVEAIPLLDLASYGFRTDGFTGDYVTFIQSHAAGMVLLQQEWVGFSHDQAGPMFRVKAQNTTYSTTQESYETELKCVNGRITYTVNGEEEDFDYAPQRTENSIMDGLYELWPDIEYLENISVTEEEDCWLLEANLNEKGMKWFHADTEFFLFNERGYLDDLGIPFDPGSGTFYVSIDKGSGLPIHSMIDLDGRHRYRGQKLAFEASLEWNYLPADPDVHHFITDEWEDTGTPEEPATPLFYQVTAPDGGRMWLLGTIHIGDIRTSYLPQELYDALLTADALAVEVDLTDLEERMEEDEDVLDAYQESVIYMDGSDAYDHLNEEQGEKLEKALKKYGGDLMASLLHYNVSALTSYLEQMTLPLGRLQSYDHGVDNQLIDLAKEHNIPVWDVEDFAEHVTLMARFSDKLQALLLEETIDGGRYGSNMSTAELFDLWCRGDEAEILQAFEEEEEEDEDLTEEEQALVEEYNRAMMEERNALMVEKAKEYLASGDTVFFAVGLAHLMGEDGIVNCLRNAGYTVEQVRYGE